MNASYHRITSASSSGWAGRSLPSTGGGSTSFASLEHHVSQLAGRVLRHREQEQRVCPERRGAHGGSHHVTVLQHRDEPARDSGRPRNAGRPLAEDAFGDRGDHRAHDWLPGEVVPRDVEELLWFVEEAQLHARRLESDVRAGHRFSPEAFLKSAGLASDLTAAPDSGVRESCSHSGSLSRSPPITNVVVTPAYMRWVTSPWLAWDRL